MLFFFFFFLLLLLFFFFAFFCFFLGGGVVGFGGFFRWKEHVRKTSHLCLFLLDIVVQLI